MVVLDAVGVQGGFKDAVVVFRLVRGQARVADVDEVGDARGAKDAHKLRNLLAGEPDGVKVDLDLSVLQVPDRLVDEFFAGNLCGGAEQFVLDGGSLFLLSRGLGCGSRGTGNEVRHAAGRGSDRSLLFLLVGRFLVAVGGADELGDDLAPVAALAGRACHLLDLSRGLGRDRDSPLYSGESHGLDLFERLVRVHLEEIEQPARPLLFKGGDHSSKLLVQRVYPVGGDAGAHGRHGLFEQGGVTFGDGGA